MAQRRTAPAESARADRYRSRRRRSAAERQRAGFKVSAEDRSLNPVATLLLNPINMHVAGFNLKPDDVLDITLDSGINSSGKISAKAKVTTASGAISAHVETASLPLTALQPYLAEYTSMTLLKGTLGSKIDFERKADGALTVQGGTQL